ncbi:hypothetical protein PFISCL1PPCAC_20982, partial [Pristionchus fissidentatus]
DQFEIQSASKRAESYLMVSTKFTRIEKLQLADQFRLNLLRDHCLLFFTSVNEICTLKDSDEYMSFSKEMKASICDRIMDL